MGTLRIYAARAESIVQSRKRAAFAYRESAENRLKELAAELKLPVERLRAIPYVFRERRGENVFPTREDFLTVAPAIVDDKAHSGLPWLEQKWAAVQLPFSEKARPRCVHWLSCPNA